MPPAKHRYRQAKPMDLSVGEQADMEAFLSLPTLGGELRIQSGKRRALLIPPALRQPILEILRQATEGERLAAVPKVAALSTQEVADRLGVSRPFVVALIESGRLPATKVGTHRRVSPKDLEAYLAKVRSRGSRALTAMMRDTRRLGLGY
jgi:excisionase family DNA binding protein